MRNSLRKRQHAATESVRLARQPNHVRDVPALLAKRESQQARAQQHQACRGQYKKSVRHQIVVAHDTPATSDARPNLLKLSESPGLKEVMRLLRARVHSSSRTGPSGPGTITFKRMGQEDPRAHQAQNCRNRLNHRKSSFAPLPATERPHRCTVKKIQWAAPKIRAE